MRRSRSIYHMLPAWRVEPIPPKLEARSGVQNPATPASLSSGRRSRVFFAALSCALARLRSGVVEKGVILFR